MVSGYSKDSGKIAADIAAGMADANPEMAGDIEGDEIFLIGGLGQKNSVEARLYYDLRRLPDTNDYGNSDMTRLELECWIKWGDRFTSPTGRYAGDIGHERRISTIMTEFET